MKKLVLTLFFVFAVLAAFAQDAYTLSAESTLMINGTSTIHDWEVTANAIEGTLKADGTDPKEIDFQVTVADIKSERGATMDKKTHNALKMESNPKVIFNLIEVKGGSSVMGTLSMAGKKQDVEIPAKVTSIEGNIKISGEYPIALQDWDIEPPTAMFGQVVVGDEVTVKFDLIFSRD